MTELWQKLVQTLRAPIARPGSVNLWLLGTALLASGLTAVQYAKFGEGYGHSVFQLGFGFGEVISNLDQGRGLVLLTPAYEAVAQRLPFIPVFLFGLNFLLKKLWLVWLVKNLAFFGLSAWSLRTFVVERKPAVWTLIACAIGMLGSSLMLFHLSALDHEEAYLSHLFFATYLMAWLKPSLGRAVLLGGILGVATLAKSSVFPIAVLWAAFVLIRWSRHRRPKLGLVPLTAVALAAVAWGGFTLAASGRFAFGANSSSLNGLNFRKGNNELTASFYPSRNLDELPRDVLQIPPEASKHEWAANDAHFEAARRFRSENPQVVERLTVEKLRVLLWSLQDDRRGGLNASLVVERPLLWLALLIAVVGIVSAMMRRSLALAAHPLLFALTVGLYAAPFLAGFATLRHIAPLAAIASAFLLSTRNA